MYCIQGGNKSFLVFTINNTCSTSIIIVAGNDSGTNMIDREPFDDFVFQFPDSCKWFISCWSKKLPNTIKVFASSLKSRMQMSYQDLSKAFDNMQHDPLSISMPSSDVQKLVSSLVQMNI